MKTTLISENIVTLITTLLSFKYLFYDETDNDITATSITTELNINHIKSQFINDHYKSYLYQNEFDIVEREGKTFGADIYGFDVGTALFDDGAVGKLRAALEKYQVLILHNVTENMTPEMHVKLAKRMGPVDPKLSSPPSYLLKGVYNSPQALKRGGESIASSVAQRMLEASQETYKLPKEITRILKKPNDKAAFGEGAHTDLSFHDSPPSYALLASRNLPTPGQGNTHFWDMRAAYGYLSDNIKSKIYDLKANHTDGAGRESSHPVVRKDHRNDELSLFVNRAFTRNIIANDGSLPTKDHHNLLEYLFDYIDNLKDNHPDTFLDINWRHGQMVIWDNRFTQHAAQLNYKTLREMHRVVVTGNKPF